MKSNYKLLGDIVRWCDERNRGEETSDVQGVSIGKEYMPSVANIIGTDLSNYKIVRVNRFACNPMHVGRDRVLPVALYTKETPAIVSPAYFTFEVINDQEVLPEYLMFFSEPLLLIKIVGSGRMGLCEEEFHGMICAVLNFLFRILIFNAK